MIPSTGKQEMAVNQVKLVKINMPHLNIMITYCPVNVEGYNNMRMSKQVMQIISD